MTLHLTQNDDKLDDVVVILFMILYFVKIL